MRLKNIYKNVTFKAAALSIVLMLALCVVFQMAPFGDGTFLTGDLNGQYINYFAQTRNAFIEGNGMDYSLYKGLGGNMTGIIAYYAASPFVLLYVLVNPVYYGLLTTFVVCAKVVLMCITMAYFLSKKLNSQTGKIVIIALSYGFAGYVFVYMQNFMWHDVLILLPVVCHGLDVLMKTKKPFIYCLALGAAVFVNFYIAYMVCIFIVMYFFYNLLLFPEKSKNIVKWQCLRFAFASLIGGLLSACLLFPALANIQDSKGVGVSNEIYLTVEFSPLQFLARLMPFGFFQPNISSDLPNVYAGVLTIILLFCFFAAKNIDARQKIVGGAVLLLLFLSMFSTDLMLLFHGFAPPVWFTHRHAFLFVFWVCFLAATALVKGVLSNKTLIIALLGMCAILITRVMFEEPVYTQNRFLFTLIEVAVLFVLLYCYTKAQKKQKKQACIFLIAAIVCAELLLNTYFIQRQFERYTNSEYRNFVQVNTELVNKAHEISNGEDFRIEKTYARSLNDSFLINYYGISHFGSTQDSNATDFLQSIGVIETTAMLYNSENTNIFADSMLGIKYLFDNGENEVPRGYINIGETNSGHTIYENPYAFPLCFMLTGESSKYTTGFDDKNSFSSKLYEVLQSGEMSKQLYDVNGAIDLDNLEELSAAVHGKAADFDFMRGEINASISADESALLFFSIPYSEHLSITVNGQKAVPEKVFNSQLAVRVNEGENIVKITYNTPGKILGIVTSVVAALLLLLWFLRMKKTLQTNTKRKDLP